MRFNFQLEFFYLIYIQKTKLFKHFNFLFKIPHLQQNVSSQPSHRSSQAFISFAYLRKWFSGVTFSHMIVFMKFQRETLINGEMLQRIVVVTSQIHKYLVHIRVHAQLFHEFHLHLKFRMKKRIGDGGAVYNNNMMIQFL